MYFVKEQGLYKNYPFWSRLEWHLARSKVIAFGLDYLFHRPRVWWYAQRRKRWLTSQSLTNFETRIFSQNGEDGIVREIFRRIGEGDKFAVEFGIGDGSECCTRNLLLNHSWAGLLIEGAKHYAENARTIFKLCPKVNVVHEYLSLENVLEVFSEHGVPASPDLLVIDIDGNDYWILRRILSAYRPRVLVMEYNSRWTPPQEWVMPYNTKYLWDGSAYFGASLASLMKLANSFDYTLVGCDSSGVNAFFVRSDLVKEHFSDHTLGFRHYSPPRYGRGFGHSVRMRQRKDYQHPSELS
jgi:hypothetical protein